MPKALFTSADVGLFTPVGEVSDVEVLESEVVGEAEGIGVAVATGDGVGISVARLMGSSERLSLETAKGASLFERATMYPSEDSETTRTLVPEGTMMNPTERPSLVSSIRELVRREPPLIGSAARVEEGHPNSSPQSMVNSPNARTG